MVEWVVSETLSQFLSIGAVSLVPLGEFAWVLTVRSIYIYIAHNM